MTNFTQSEYIAKGGRFSLGEVKGLPCSGYITTLFNVVDRLHPSGHTGVDIGGVGSNTPVLAPAAGKVKFVSHVGMAGWESWVSTYGNSVILDHGDCYTLYAHLSSVSVREGLSVTAGTRLGVTGNTGFSEGAHLHWAMATTDNPWFQRGKGLLDPLAYCKKPVPVEKLSPPLDGNEPTGKVWLGLYDAVQGGTEGTYKRLPQQKPGWGRYEFEIRVKG